jgi:4-amino-4-deoxy-L-arabinose transferase-like glycosyltransferase
MWDAIALYDYRAKNMVLLGKIVGSFSVSSDTYPLLTSLSHGVIYLFGGTNPQYLYFLFLLSLSVIFYFFLRRFLSRKYCLVSLLFLISIPLLIQQAQVTLADLPQSAYLVPAFLYLILGLIGGKKSQILLSGMLFSLGAWVRNEPFWMVGFVVLFVFSFKRKWFIIDGLYCVFANIVSHFWVNFINSHSLASSTSEVVKPNLFTDQLHTLLSLHYWITVILFVFNNILLLTLPLYIAMILLLILKRKVLNKTAIILTCLICGIILLFTAGSAFYILTTDYWPALYSSLQRIIIFLDVLVVADISLLFFPGVSNFGV